ncbi:MAG: SpoIIE family protein phosphatase [Armatimonadota bacterium]|nr:SpoIIE family protein phosphatase [Armatimonadota bacterium]
MQAPQFNQEEDQEEARLAALQRFDILDTPREEEFEDVTRLVAHLCDAPIATITLVDRERQWFVAEIGLGVRETPRDVSICSHAILQPGIFIVPDTLLDERFVNNPLVTGEPHLRFYAGALLKTREGHALGTLCVLDYQPRELTEAQKDALQVLAGQVMKQIELRWLLREQASILAEQEQARVRLAEAYRREQQITETLQRSLLIDMADHTFPGLEVEPLYEAAWDEADVGGDFYDAFMVSETQVALVIGDVAGKGLAAAARTAEVKYALRAFLQEYPYPARTLARLNDFLCRFHEYQTEANPRFVVIILALVDTQTGEVTCSLAGAEPPFVLRRGGGADIQMGSGLPLGIQSAAEYETLSWRMESGDTLILATDGLTEVRQGNTYLDYAGLVRLACEAQNSGPLRAMGESLLQQVKDFSGLPLQDDACLLLARRV